MDFETTGLIDSDSRDPLEKKAVPGQRNRNLEELLKAYIRLGYDRPEQMPRITEMSFVAVPRPIFVEAIENMQTLSNLLEEDVEEPLTVSAAVNVHTRQLNPQLTERDWVEYERQRRQCDSMYLSRADLVVKNTFPEEWPGVLNFLQLVKKPACFVAHNGARFDYRILFCELSRHGLLETQSLPDHIYFLDSYLTFMDIEKEYHASVGTAVRCIDWRLVTQAVMYAANTPQKKGDRVDEQGYLETSATKTSVSAPSTPLRDAKMERALKRRMPRLHLTPDAKRTPVKDVGSGSETAQDSPSGNARRRLFDDLSEAHPLRFMRKDDWSPAKKRRLRDHMFNRSDNGNWHFDDHRAYKHFSERGNFKLGTLFRELTNDDFRAHRAQEDCEALLQTCAAYGKDFLDYADTYRADFRFFRPYSARPDAKKVQIAVESTTTTTTTTVKKSVLKAADAAEAVPNEPELEDSRLPEETEATSSSTGAAEGRKRTVNDDDDDDGGWLKAKRKPL
ncbi:Protein W02F12.4 d [Aphelenchoides avenae]|nr:Protein W02F12.4 d [Aphelenchus avenae]